MLKKYIYLIAVVSNFLLLNISILSFPGIKFDDFAKTILKVIVREKLSKKKKF